ncbi:unknown [Gryllus bimaculatus nudivirus]|uniref:Uncharacterized protein n=1 Tax=Gryllus bimaculatus nudivirus TaxID=432587 RepID=A4L213_9VIRU|nr:hypothetical protein GrBNV_gp50 [Gryllus bimaculatus nudivirus]ABO45383.1 unknown [Gryllus bimaculatus nudivirus]
MTTNNTLKNMYAEKDKELLNEEETSLPLLLFSETSRRSVDDDGEEENFNFSGTLKVVSGSRPSSTFIKEEPLPSLSTTEDGSNAIEKIWFKLLDIEEKHQNSINKYTCINLQEMINLELVYWDVNEENLILNKSVIRKCGFIVIYDLKCFKPVIYSITDLFYNSNLCVYLSNQILKSDVNFFINSYKLLKLKANPQFSS